MQSPKQKRVFYRPNDRPPVSLDNAGRTASKIPPQTTPPRHLSMTHSRGQIGARENPFVPPSTADSKRKT